MSDITLLESHISDYGSALLGYSGGVDSAVVALAATRALGRERFLAVIGDSPSLARRQMAQAMAVADQFAIPVLSLATEELDDPSYRSNDVNRCYFCKSELWSRLTRLASRRGFAVVMEGTNADDLAEHRPGLKAASEKAVRAPLAELGWSKARVRRAAREAGLPIWQAPAAPCLASRIRYGVPVTRERLALVERAETWLRDRGVTGDLRVRHTGDGARVEVSPQLVAELQQDWPVIEANLIEFGFDFAELAPEGYRRGALLDDVSP